MNSSEKRDSVRENYDKVAEPYSAEFGTYIEDLDAYEELAKRLPANAAILDLGAGSGRTYAYFNERGRQYTGLDFSTKMREKAFQIHGEFPYIVDDMMNLKNHCAAESLDAVFAVYSLFHLPKDDFVKIFADIRDVLKPGGLLLFSYQVGQGEEFADEPYLGAEGKGACYMDYHTREEVAGLLKNYGFESLWTKEKIETTETAVNNNDAIVAFNLVRKK